MLENVYHWVIFDCPHKYARKLLPHSIKLLFLQSFNIYVFYFKICCKNLFEFKYFHILADGDINEVLIKTLAEAHANTNTKLEVVHEMFRKPQVISFYGIHIYLLYLFNFFRTLPEYCTIKIWDRRSFGWIVLKN